MCFPGCSDVVDGGGDAKISQHGLDLSIPTQPLVAPMIGKCRPTPHIRTSVIICRDPLLHHLICWAVANERVVSGRRWYVGTKNASSLIGCMRILNPDFIIRSLNPRTTTWSPELLFRPSSNRYPLV